jgi:hypothetical protein
MDSSQQPTNKLPFLTEIVYLGKSYVGIVQNTDCNFVHMYVVDQTMPLEQKKEFLACGDCYWWGSNRQIPINVFLHERFRPFKNYLKSFVRKEVVLVTGPMPSLDNLLNKRSKKRTVQLVKSTG